jgi:hypothetical protein
MRAQVSAGEGGITGLSLVFADDPGDAATAELSAMLTDEERVLVTSGLVESVLGNVGA